MRILISQQFAPMPNRRKQENPPLLTSTPNSSTSDYERRGFMSQCVAWLKKLEAGTFSWPTGSEAGKAKLSLRAEALEMLLSGIDLKGAKLRPWYESDR